MSTSRLHPFASVLGLVLVLGTGSGWSAHDGAPPLGDDDVELAREELASGRHWHAAELLLAYREANGGLEPEAELLLARARAGFRDWSGVRELLDGAAWMESGANPEARALLGRALEAADEWAGAVDAYRRALSESPEEDPLVLARLARVELHGGRVQESRELLEGLLEYAPGLASAVAYDLASGFAESGDTAVVGAMTSVIRSEFLADRGRAFVATAALAAGDSARAAEEFAALAAESGGSTRARYRSRVAELALARGDTVEARNTALETLRALPYSRGGMNSAAILVDLGGLERDDALRAARSLDRSGDGRRALAAYDAYVAASRQAGVEADPKARVERARIASTVPGRVAEAVEEYRALDEHPDPAVGARVLDLWAGLRRRQGQTNNVRTLRRWLLERYPDTDQAAQVVFLRGDYAQDLRDWGGAVGHYRDVVEMAPTRELAGRARMRIAQIRLQQGEVHEALDEYQAYLADYPEGRRWAEAGFWAGELLLQLGDTTAAQEQFERVVRGEPQSYYGTLSADRLGAEALGVLEPAPTLTDAPWVADALVRLDLLMAAELEEVASIQVDALARRADAEGPAAQYPLAEGLIDRGWTIEGINRGWALTRAGESHNERLLRILYPYPERYREMVEREAAEWGLDPVLMAALIRQESAWDSDIVSPAGAVGLMQVMEPTGRQLARAIGPKSFRRASLESAEVNLHLGGRFLRDMLNRFGPDLPLVLSAYNAGPTRANRWKNFPEAPDPLRFTERIPFAETRGYVKNVTRNLGIYRRLYGSEQAPAISP